MKIDNDQIERAKKQFKKKSGQWMNRWSQSVENAKEKIKAKKDKANNDKNSR